jgi:hypothetical protein
MEELRIRLENSIQAEEIMLQGAVLTRLERACRKATRDAFVLVLEMVDEQPQCPHCLDDPPDKHTCPACGRTTG